MAWLLGSKCKVLASVESLGVGGGGGRAEFWRKVWAVRLTLESTL